jgi:hypothetical protein
MKKVIFILFSMFLMNSTFAQEKDFVHAKPDTSEMIIETSGLLKAGIKQCDFSKEELQKINQYLENIREIVHFYDAIPYKTIDDYTQKSEKFYMNNFNLDDCSNIKEDFPDIINFPDSLIFEQLYTNVQNMPKDNLKDLNKDYIYSHKFVSSQISGYSSGQNTDGTIWIGKLTQLEQCKEKSIKTKDSSFQTYCDNGYAKTLVYIP